MQRPRSGENSPAHGSIPPSQETRADHVEAHLLSQTDVKPLGGQRAPRQGRLCGRGQPARVQVPKLLVVSVDTEEAQLSPCRREASGHKGLAPGAVGGRCPTKVCRTPECPDLLGPRALWLSCTHGNTHKPARSSDLCQMSRLSYQPPANTSPTCLHKSFPLQETPFPGLSM